MATTTVTPVPAAERQRNLWEKAMCLQITRKWPSLSKTVQEKILNTTGDQRWFSVSKKLYESQELRDLFALDQRIDDFLDSICLPFPLKRGVRILPNDLYSRVENALMAHLVEMEPKVEAFVAKLEEIKQNSKTMLGDQYNDADYPSAAQARAAFRFYWQYLQFNVADQLRQIDKDVAEREEAKIKAEWTEANNIIQQTLRTSMAEFVNTLVEKLTPETDQATGEKKKKRFHAASLEKMHAFIETFDARNLTDDAELKKIVEQAKQLTNGVTPDAIRNNESLRENMKKGFDTIKASLDTLIGVAPTRAMKFED